jgi:hypothetical protein
VLHGDGRWLPEGAVSRDEQPDNPQENAMNTHKKSKLALARETIVELRPQVLAAVNGGAGGVDPSVYSCLRYCGQTATRPDAGE